MGLQGPVLSATDLSDAADAALRQGRRLASDLGAPFVVCHVLPEAFRVRVLFPQDAGIDTSFQQELERTATLAVRQRIDLVAGSEAGPTPIEVETGTAHAGILTVAERIGAGVIVLGPGATAHRVARAAAGPVLIARPSPTGGSVLAATDLSDPAVPAVRMAADEARRRHARLRVVHCLDLGETAYLGGIGIPGVMSVPPLPQRVIDRFETAARARLVHALDAAETTAETVVLRKPAADGIVEAAREVATSLIVVGTRGRTGLARLALGSVAEAVVNTAPCSVLVVPLHPD